MQKLIRRLMPLSAVVAAGGGNNDASEKVCQVGSAMCACYDSNFGVESEVRRI
jgi:hypothetical protein